MKVKYNYTFVIVQIIQIQLQKETKWNLEAATKEALIMGNSAECWICHRMTDATIRKNSLELDISIADTEISRKFFSSEVSDQTISYMRRNHLAILGFNCYELQM